MTKHNIQLFFLAIVLAFSILSDSLNAQTAFFLHTVTKGQSLYSISRMYSVSVEDIIKINPGSENVIREGQTLRIPQTVSEQSQEKRFHTIQSGETLYRLSLKYNVTAKAICDANPGLSANNFRAGQVIVIPAADAHTEQQVETPEPEKKEEATKQQSYRTMHRVAKKETIYSISNMYGITQEELIDANPELRTSKLRKGALIFIPYPKAKEKAQQKAQTEPTNEQLFNQNRIQLKKIQTVSAALVLPFTKQNGSRGDNEERMLEFYEGFLLAADSLKHQGVSMKISVYDTKGNPNRVKELILQGKLDGMDLIFGPTGAEETKTLADFVKGTETRLVAPFAPKVDEVYDNPNVFQVNAPQSYLFSEAYEHFIRKFRTYNIVFVSDSSSTEKREFINGMKSELRDKGIGYKHIQLSDEVDGVNVIAAMDTLGRNIFIPTSGANTALIRIIPHLTLVRKEHPDFDMHLFGYPEWQTYTNEHLGSFYELDTYFYSSFYTNNLFPAAVLFTHNYRHWFSKDMSNSFPKYGMLGFDVGYYFIKGLAQNGNKLESNLDQVHVTPIQTGFKFERVNNWGGFVNRKVFFVNFSKNYELIKLDFD